MRLARSQGRQGGGGEIAAVAASCGGRRDPRTTPNLLAAALPKLPNQIRSDPRQNQMRR
jgi:hypothetical protein